MLAPIGLALAALAVLCVVELRVPAPMLDVRLFRIKPFALGNLAGLMASVGRGGLLLMAATFIALTLIPVNFGFPVFAVLIFLNGVGGGVFTAPNTAAIMSSVPAAERGAASGIRATFTNAGRSLSIGIFFSLMIAGLAHSSPGTLSTGLQQQGVSGAVSHQVASLPPVGSLFAAFLGCT